MKASSRYSLFKFCPKSGRIVRIRSHRRLSFIFLPLVGFLALIWFVIRVVPKPSRAAYPCQRVAVPLAGSFVVWLIGAVGASLAFRQARAKMRQARYASAAVALLVAVLWITWATFNQRQPVQAVPIAYTPHPANTPIGTAKGLMPGRVAWVHNPQVTDWDGVSTTIGQRWYERIDQNEATNMMQWVLLGYTDKTTSSDAWDAMFEHFNDGVTYQPGEKIFIKVNLVTSAAPYCADSNYNWYPSSCGASWTSIGQSPQLLVALLDQLVNVVGVAQSDITIGDSTGLWVNELYDILYGDFPDVKYMDAKGTLGRTLSTKSTVPLYWSTSEADDNFQDYLLQAVVDAKYVIDFAILKSHERAGITTTAKNHFGSLSGGNSDPRKPDTANFYDLHQRLALETGSGAWPDRAVLAQYRPLVDLNSHAGLGGKTLLYMLDSIYAGRGWNGMPSKWGVQPFCITPACAPGDEFWPSSLFLSMDQVAIDSVAFDFLSMRSDWTEVLAAEGVQDYLHEMALASEPPSGTLYDPEHDGFAAVSQGAHEHWNNSTNKQYSRNLGSGDGIDLLYITGDPSKNAVARKIDRPINIDGDVDAAWASTPIHFLNNIVLGGDTILDASDLSASFRALYDDSDLYLLVDVVDDQLVNDSPLWRDDDCVEIMIDGDYSRDVAYDGINDFDLGVCWNDLAIQLGTYSASVPAGAAVATASTGSGYRVEIKLPLVELGIPPVCGQLFGLDVQVVDDDSDGPVDARMAWWGTDDSGWQDPTVFGAGRLEGPHKSHVVPDAQGAGVLLQWTHFAWNDVYEVHRSLSPYFTPDENSYVESITPPQSEYHDAEPGSSYYYIIRAKQSELGVDSNRTGKFQFNLTAP